MQLVKATGTIRVKQISRVEVVVDTARRLLEIHPEKDSYDNRSLVAE